MERGYDVTSHEGVIKSGENGPAVIPGSPENSLLVKVLKIDVAGGTRIDGVTYHQMPFVGKALPAKEIALIEEWIRQGAKKDDLPVDHVSVVLDAVSLKLSSVERENITVRCRVPVESYAQIFIRDPETGQILAQKGGTIQADRPDEREYDQDLGTPATVKTWLQWGLDGNSGWLPLQNQLTREQFKSLPDVVDVELSLTHYQSPVWGTEFRVERVRPQEVIESKLVPNPAQLSGKRPVSFSYQIYANADVKIEVHSLPANGQKARLVFEDEKRDLIAGTREYHWHMKGRDGKDVSTGPYAARFRCQTRNKSIPVNDVVVLFSVME